MVEPDSPTWHVVSCLSSVLWCVAAVLPLLDRVSPAPMDATSIASLQPHRHHIQTLP